MTEQVASKVGIEYAREISTSEIEEVAEGVRLETVDNAVKALATPEQEQNKDEQSRADE